MSVDVVKDQGRRDKQESFGRDKEVGASGLFGIELAKVATVRAGCDEGLERVTE
jgi:hypothetical protein